MQSNSLRAMAVLSLSLGAAAFLAVPTCAQAASGSHGAAPQSNGAADRGPDDVDGLPAFLLPVPGGAVVMGLEPDQFVDAIAQATFALKPDKAHEIATEKFVTAMRRSASLLGQQKVDVAPFLLGKWPVKNSEYLVFVEKQRAAQIEVRPPYHWWRYGRVDDYNEKLPAINAAFPKDPLGGVRFWERHGHELSFKVQDEKGNPIPDLPVVFVSWRDANRFAASIGMRLPTEAELTRAMRGDGAAIWPGEEYGDPLLKRLQMYNSSEWVLKPVGTVAAATGPFGHLDMFGQVWQFCGDLGYLPIVGVDAYEKPWEKLQKHKIGRLLEAKPAWRFDLAIAKCGSYLSYQEPVQLLIDARAPMGPGDVFESVGLRLAKSLKPGYDFLYSLQRVAFNRNAFAKDQDLDLSNQVGAERYTLAENGFPSDYQAVSFAPVNWLVDEKRVRLADVLDGSQERPIVVGGLASTAKFDNGVEAGLYAVLYRQKGVPRALSDAVKRGHKEVLKERKMAEKGLDKKDDGDDDPEQNTWRSVVRSYGLTDDDIADKAAADGDPGFVRIDDIVVPTDRDAFLLSAAGKVVGVLPGTNAKPAAGPAFAARLVIEPGSKDAKDKAVAKFEFGVPMLARDPKKVVTFDLHAALDLAAPTEEAPWRLPKIE